MNRLIKEAENLPNDQKLALANRVLEMSEPDETESTRDAWDLEIRERIVAFDKGVSPSRSASDVFRDLDSRLPR